MDGYKGRWAKRCSFHSSFLILGELATAQAFNVKNAGLGIEPDLPLLQGRCPNDCVEGVPVRAAKIRHGYGVGEEIETLDLAVHQAQFPDRNTLAAEGHIYGPGDGVPRRRARSPSRT